MVPYNIKKRIIDETNIVEVVGEYVSLQKKGNSYFGLCPFHNDNHPSMSVSNHVKMFNCFSCGAKGNVINFVSRYENITEDEACVKLAARLGIKIDTRVANESKKETNLKNIAEEACKFYEFYLFNSKQGKVALEYLYNRGINDDIIKKFRIGLAPDADDELFKVLTKKEFNVIDLEELGLCKAYDGKPHHDVFRNRVMFPLSNGSGQVIGFSGRIYTDSNQAKYINSIESTIFHKGEVLYNMHNAYLPAKKNDRIFLVEGFMDVIAAYRCGIDYGVATMGTALTNDHIKQMLAVTKKIVLCFDGDEAGIHAMQRSAMILSKFNIIPEAVVLPDNMDPDEYIKKYSGDELKNYLLTKSKQVYYWLYFVAKKKLIKGDLISVENFKKEVFTFLNYTTSETVIDFYLGEVAKDLDISFDSIKKDFEAVRKPINKNNFGDNSGQFIDDGLGQVVEEGLGQVIDDVFPGTSEVIQPVPPKHIIKPKTYKAYEMIIYYILHNPRKILYLMDKVKSTCPPELTTQISILIEIHQNYAVYGDDLTYDQLLSNLEATPEFKEYIENNVLNKYPEFVTDLCFEQSIETVRDQILKIQIADLKDKINHSSSPEETKKYLDEMLEIKREQRTKN